MTIPQLLQILPQMREWFPREIVQDWSLEEWDRSMQAVRARTMAGLDEWRERGAICKNGE